MSVGIKVGIGLGVAALSGGTTAYAAQRTGAHGIPLGFAGMVGTAAGSMYAARAIPNASHLAVAGVAAAGLTAWLGATIIGSELGTEHRTDPMYPQVR